MIRVPASDSIQRCRANLLAAGKSCSIQFLLPPVRLFDPVHTKANVARRNFFPETFQKIENSVLRFRVALLARVGSVHHDAVCSATFWLKIVSHRLAHRPDWASLLACSDVDVFS
jgi:hypothetical protein